MEDTEKESILYELGADATCAFGNGEILKVSKAMLAFHSKYFKDEFFGPPPKDRVKIENFDRDTFKTFLDCLFELKEYTVLDSLLIYPIAYAYDVKKSLRKCAAVLEPKEMSENVCVTLNLAVFYKSEDLAGKVIDFIKKEIGIINLMENNEYRILLEPATVSRLLNDIKLRSFVWELIYEWGNDYLKHNNKSVDINLFLKESEILSKLQVADFESVQSVFQFLKTSKGTLISSEEVSNYLEKKLLASDERFPKRSEWFKLEKKSINESIEFSNSVICSGNMSLEIFVNEVFIDNNDKNGDNKINLTVQYQYRTVSAQLGENSFSINNSCNCTANLVTTGNYFAFTGARNQAFAVLSPPEKPAHSSTIGAVPNRLVEVKSVEIAYEFANFDRFRILKSTLDSNCKNSEGLYFTRKVTLKTCD